MTIEKSKINSQAVKLASTKVPRTYEQICLDKLKEIGRSTAREWCRAMGYTTPNSLAKVIRRIKAKTPEKLKIYGNRKPRLYEAI